LVFYFETHEFNMIANLDEDKKRKILIEKI